MGNSNPWNPGPSPAPPRRPEVQRLADLYGVAIGYVIRETDGQTIAKDPFHRPLGRFDGRDTTDAVGRPLTPFDSTTALVLDEAEKRRKRRF